MKPCSVPAANNQNTPNTIWNRAFVYIFIVNMVLNLTQFMMNALVPKYAEYLGATPAIVGVVSSMFALTAIGIRPVVGPATGYFRNNRLLAAALAIILLAFVCYGISDSVEVVIMGRLLHGIGMGFLAPLTLSLASNALPGDKIAQGIGIFSLGQAVATAFGPSLGIELVNAVGYHRTFFVGTAMMAVVLLMVLRMQTDAPDKSGGFRISLDNVVAKEVLVPAVMMFFLAGAYSCINSFILIYGYASGVEEIGLFFTAYAAFILFSRPFSGKIADKYGLDKSLVPGMLMFALSFVLISFSRSLPMFILSGAVSAFGYGICQPLVQTLCMKLVSRERRGVAGNTNYIGVDLGYLIMPPIAGAIVSRAQSRGETLLAGYSEMYRWMMIPIGIALLIFLAQRRRLKAMVLND